MKIHELGLCGHLLIKQGLGMFESTSNGTVYLQTTGLLYASMVGDSASTCFLWRIPVFSALYLFFSPNKAHLQDKTHKTLMFSHS